MSKKNYIIPIFVPHRGCPHDCIFCNQKKITGVGEDVCQNGISGPEVTEVIHSYLKTMTNQSAHIEVAFYGGSFTGIPISLQKELLTAAYEYKKKNLIHGIRLSTRPDYIDDQILEYLEQYGVDTIELGVQSLDDKVLELSNRGHRQEHVQKAVALIRKYDFVLGLQMMIGLPGDNVEKMFYTAQEIIRLKPDMVRIYPTLVIKGTALEQLYRNGQYRPLLLEETVNICKNLLLNFEKHGIKVIRIGLQATENIAQGKDIIAGPFHPAFRELVEAEIRLDMLKLAISHLQGDLDEINIFVHPRAVSEIVGPRRKNLIYLQKKYGLNKTRVFQDENLKRDEIVVSTKNQSYHISKKNL